MASSLIAAGQQPEPVDSSRPENASVSQTDTQTTAAGHTLNVEYPANLNLKASDIRALPSLPVPVPVQHGGFILNWGDRIPVSKIQLTGSAQTAPPSAEPSSESDETTLLLQQLDELDELDASSSVEPPLVIPEFIDRPDEIDDRNVGPIPTQPTDIVEGSASETGATTIPVVPDKATAQQNPEIDKPGSVPGPPDPKQSADSQQDLYEATPRLLTHSNRTSPPTSNASAKPARVWQIATAQLLATFLGILLAVGLFLLIRAAAMKLFETSLGVTFQIGSVASSSSQTKDVEMQEGTDIAETQPAPDAVQVQQPDEAKRTGDTSDPDNFPFRVIGGSNGTDDSVPEGNINGQLKSAMLKSVFDDNLDMIGKRDTRDESAA